LLRISSDFDAAANHDNRTHINAADSKPVLRIAADEEAMIRDLVVALLNSPSIRLPSGKRADF